MKKSAIFFKDPYKDIEKKIVKFLNGQPELLSSRTAQSPAPLVTQSKIFSLEIPVLFSEIL